MRTIYSNIKVIFIVTHNNKNIYKQNNIEKRYFQKYYRYSVVINNKFDL